MKKNIIFKHQSASQMQHILGLAYDIINFKDPCEDIGTQNTGRICPLLLKLVAPPFHSKTWDSFLFKYL